MPSSCRYLELISRLDLFVALAELWELQRSKMFCQTGRVACSGRAGDSIRSKGRFTCVGQACCDEAQAAMSQ